MSYSDKDLDVPMPIQATPHLTKRDLMDATKQAVKELMREQITEFGWWSLKTGGVAVVGAVILFVLWANGYGKH